MQALSHLQNIDPDDNFFNDIYSGLALETVSPYYNIDNYNNTFKRRPQTLNIMTFNVRSLNRNGELFTSLLSSLYRPPDILVLTETWWKRATRLPLKWRDTMRFIQFEKVAEAEVCLSM